MLTKLEIKSHFEVRTYTVKEVFEAIKKNGFEHLRDEWTSYGYNGKPVGACVLGQGALNLNVPPSNDNDVHDSPFIEDLLSNATDYDEQEKIANVYDELETKYNVVTQLDRFQVKETSKWYQVGRSTCGHAIVHWNDAVDYEDNDRHYVLETYEEVVDMVFDVLKPHMAKKVRLVSRVYDN